jgi:hypothetical protein
MALSRKTNITGDKFVSIDGLFVSTGETLDAEWNTYVKVDSVQGSKDAASMVVSFKNTNTGEVFSHKSYKFIPAMDSKNFIAQAYEHLKTLPEFAGAIDC